MYYTKYENMLIVGIAEEQVQENNCGKEDGEVSQ